MKRPTRTKSEWFNLLCFLIGVALLVALVLGFGWRGALAHLQRMGWGVAWVVLVFLATALLETAAWWLGLDRKVGLGKLLGVQLAARSINSLTPLGEGGEVLKVTMLPERIPLMGRVASVLGWNWHQRTTKHALILVSPLWALVAGSHAVSVAALWTYTAAALIAAIPTAFLGIALFKGGTGAVMRLLGKLGLLKQLTPPQLAQATNSLSDALRPQIRPSGWRNGVMMLMLLGARLLSALEIHLILIWLGVPITFADSTLLYGATLIARQALSVSPVQLGVGEGGELVAFKLLLLPLPAGLTQAVIRAAIRLVFTFVGMIVLGLSGRARRQTGEPILKDPLTV